MAVDEAFADLAAGFASLASARPANAVVLRSLTKVFAVPGLRLGVALADPALAARWRAALPPWTVNHLAQVVGARALGDALFSADVASVANWRASLAQGLTALPGLTVVPGAADFLLCRHHQEALPARLLQRHALAVRRCDDYPGLGPAWFRVTVRYPGRERPSARCPGQRTLPDGSSGAAPAPRPCADGPGHLIGSG